MENTLTQLQEIALRIREMREILGFSVPCLLGQFLVRVHLDQNPF